MSTQRLKVIHLTIGLEWGGAEKLMAHMASRLDPSRFDVQVVSLQREGPVGQWLREAGIPVMALETCGRWDFRAYLRWRQFLAAEMPDIVHAHLLRANLLACLTRKHHAVVWHEHGTGEWLNPAVKRLERYFMVRSDAVIAISNHVRDNLVSRVPDIASRVTLLPNAIDTRSINAVSPSEKQRIRQEMWGLGPEHQIVGYVGRLDEQFKGITFLLRSIAQLKSTWPHLRLVLVGEGKDRQSLENSAHQLSLQDSIQFMGARSDLHQIYPGFDLLALPSLSEGFGIVLLEAMAASLPVVASRVGGIQEVVVDQETGLLTPPGNSKALAETLEVLLKNPERRKQMGQKGRDRVLAQYDLMNILSKLEQLYISLHAAMSSGTLSQ